MQVIRGSYFKMIVLILTVVVWLTWDISHAARIINQATYKSFKMLKEFDAVSSATTKVSIVRSDDTDLSNPLPRNDNSIDYDQVEEIVRRAIDLAGGFNWIIKSGDMVLLKPNIVDPEPPGSGEVTDVRVIKALIKIIDELDPGNIEIVVGEGAPDEMDYELPYSSRTNPGWTKLWDVAGYQDLLADTSLSGINFRLSNLNGSPPESPWDDLVQIEIPYGGEADPHGGQYWIHKDVLNADVFITVPVMKIHSTGVTAGLKNQIGIAPSTRYGFYKSLGVPQDNYQTKLIHKSDLPHYWTDKEIVDFCNIAQIKFVVVDAIACLETKKSATRMNGTIINLVRMNMIVAGTDPVAVDHVCTRLMGLNPDDIEHITLAEKVGLGTNNPDNINIVGADLDETKIRFKKSYYNEGRYGQGNRIWLMKGPYSIDGITDPIDHEFMENEASVHAVAGSDRWSEPVYSIDDRFDLKDYFILAPGADVVGYAYAYFNAPETQEAELWIGSDEALKIFINGEEVHRYGGTRSFKDDELLSEKVTVQIQAGENSLMVKTLQKHGRYDFCINICEPETDPNFDGNRIWGLKFTTESINTVVLESDLKPNLDFSLRNVYPNPFNNSVKIVYEIAKPGLVRIQVYDMLGREVCNLLDEEMQNSGENTLIWDGKDEYGNVLPGGTYSIHISGNGKGSDSKKVIYLK